MWVKILKGLYFPTCSILEARKEARASWAWTCILKGRDFFKENMLWKIMNEEDVCIWEDKWIPGVRLQKPTNGS